MESVFRPLPRGDLLFKGTIPGRAYVKKNGAKVWRGKMVYTPQYRSWEDMAILMIRQSMNHRSGLFPIQDPVILAARFFLADRSSEPDLSALYEGLQDVLQKCGVIANDRLIVSHDGSMKLIGPIAKTDFALFAMGS